MNKRIVEENAGNLIWIRTRFRRVKNSDKMLDDHDYGYKYWQFPIKKKVK